MAQHDMILDDQAGLAFLADLNAALAALVGNSSGATEPATMTAYMWWADTSSGWLKQRNAANNAWINKMKLADATTAVGAALISAADAAAARSAIGASGQTQEATRFAAGGTADAITGTLSPAIASYAAGLRVTTTPGGANTVTGPTLNLNSLGTKTIKKRDSGSSKVALVAGDYNASGPFDFEYDGTDFILLNPVAAAASGVPAGTVIFHSANTAPTGFIKANGAAISRTTYAALFAAIGTAFGVGDGSTTFNVPDLRGEFPRGWDDSRGVDSGRAFGSAQAEGLKNHKHAFNTPNGASTGSATWGSFYNEATTMTDVSGGETRPRNIALLACIKY